MNIEELIEVLQDVSRTGNRHVEIKELKVISSEEFNGSKGNRVLKITGNFLKYGGSEIELITKDFYITKVSITDLELEERIKESKKDIQKVEEEEPLSFDEAIHAMCSCDLKEIKKAIQAAFLSAEESKELIKEVDNITNV